MCVYISMSIIVEYRQMSCRVMENLLKTLRTHKKS